MLFSCKAIHARATLIRSTRNRRFVCIGKLRGIAAACREFSHRSCYSSHKDELLDTDVTRRCLRLTDWLHSEGHTKYIRERQWREQQLFREELDILGTQQVMWLQRWHSGNCFAPQIGGQSQLDMTNKQMTGGITSFPSSLRAVQEVVDVLLLNLGTPESPALTSLWNYLRGKENLIVWLPRHLPLGS